MTGIKSKKAQLHLPLEMIFSILLVAVFLAVVFFVIRNFLDVQKCAQIGLFVRDLQSSVDEVWKAQEASTEFEAELPPSIKYVCFVNLSQDKNLAGLDTEEKEIAGKIYDDLAVYFKYRNTNLFFYPIKAACNIPAHNIRNINLGGLSNPYCMHLSKIKIKLSKGFDESLVRVTSISEVPVKEREKKIIGEEEEYKEQSIDLSVLTKQSLSILQGESAVIKVEKKHKLKLEEAALESAAIFLDSTFIRIKVNETQMVDINRNGVADLTITLNKIQDNAATLVFEKLVEDRCSICIADCTKAFSTLPKIPIVQIPIIKFFVPPASECLKRCKDKGLCEREKFEEKEKFVEICRTVRFFRPSGEILAGEMQVETETICGLTLETIQEKASKRASEFPKIIRMPDVKFEILEKEEIEQPNEPELKTKVCEGNKLKCCDKLLYTLTGVIEPPPSKGQIPRNAKCIGYYWTDCSASLSCRSIPLVTYPLVSQPVILESVSCTYSC